MFHLLEAMAVASAGVHVLGYATYVAFMRRGQIDANPLSWLMFAYGTGLLTFLEYRSGAVWIELLLPLACSASSIVVAGLCVRNANVRQLGFPDIAAFSIDVALTLAYAGIWAAYRDGLRGAYADFAVLALLACTNLTTLTAFTPILRSTFINPSNERVLPWAFWTIAYGLLLAVTLRDITSIGRLSLLLYPALNTALHLCIAVLAASRWWRSSMRSQLRVGHTPNTGLGLFTARPIQRGQRAFLLTGAVRRWESKTTEDASKNENWSGIGKDLWIEPDAPYMFINHNCSPNLGVRGERDFVALRDIDAGEELTFDYSITEAESDWRMECRCGAPDCRGVIGPVQTLPYDAFLRYLPYIGTYFRKLYVRCQAPLARTNPAAEFAAQADRAD